MKIPTSRQPNQKTMEVRFLLRQGVRCESMSTDCNLQLSIAKKWLGSQFFGRLGV